MKCKTFPFSHLSTSIKEQLLLQGKSAILTLARYHNAFMMWGLPKQLPFLSLGKEAQLYLGWDFWLWQLDTSLDSRLGCGLRTPLSASFPAGTPRFSPLSWKWQWQKVIPCSPLLQAAAPLVWTPTPLPLQRNSSKLNVAWAFAWNLLSRQRVSQKLTGTSHFLPPMIKITLKHCKWIRFDSRTNRIWERQKKRSWGTVLSLKCTQFLSFSEKRNNCMLLRTFSRRELEYTPLHCFLIETARRLQRRGESWLLKVSSCFKGWPALKRGLSAWCSHRKGPRGWIHAGLRSGKCWASIQITVPWKKKAFQRNLRCLWLKTGCFLK